MGMFDTAYLPCAKCGQLVGFQSKSGPCILAEYSYPDIPLDVLHGLTDKPYDTRCKSCHAYLEVGITAVAFTRQIGPKRGPGHFVADSGGPDSDE